MKEPWVPFGGDDIQKAGKALGLFYLLCSKDLDQDGKIFGGKAIPLRWLQIWLGGDPLRPKRTVRRWMQHLREKEFIQASIDKARSGLSITICEPYRKKFMAPGPFAPQRASAVSEGKGHASRNGKTEIDPYVETQQMLDRIASRLQQRT